MTLAAHPKNEWTRTVWYGLLRAKSPMTIADIELRYGKPLDGDSTVRLKNACDWKWFKRSGRGLDALYSACIERAPMPRRHKKSAKAVNSIFDYADRFKEAA